MFSILYSMLTNYLTKEYETYKFNYNYYNHDDYILHTYHQIGKNLFFFMIILFFVEIFCLETLLILIRIKSFIFLYFICDFYYDMIFIENYNEANNIIEKIIFIILYLFYYDVVVLMRTQDYDDDEKIEKPENFETITTANFDPNCADFCGICLERASSKTTSGTYMVCLINCTHHFCESCLLEWQKQSYHCPYCFIESDSYLILYP